MAKSIIWVHGDNINPYAPTFKQFPDSPAIFVFDDALLATWNISLKRIVFLYECLLELPVSIQQGNVVDRIVQFASEHETDEIITMDSPSPRFAELVDSLKNQMGESTRIQVLQETPLVAVDDEFDYKRFSRYWRKAKPYAMRYK